MIEVLIGLVLVLLLVIVQTVVWTLKLVVALLRAPFLLVARAQARRSAHTLAA